MRLLRKPKKLETEWTEQEQCVAECERVIGLSLSEFSLSLRPVRWWHVQARLGIGTPPTATREGRPRLLAPVSPPHHRLLNPFCPRLLAHFSYNLFCNAFELLDMAEGSNFDYLFKVCALL